MEADTSSAELVAEIVVAAAVSLKVVNIKVGVVVAVEVDEPAKPQLCRL